MISIITAVFNQRGMNQLFYEKLVEYTENPFELIIIDNNSTDGSREYFENKKFVKLIKNDGNYSYPFCQNQGIKAAEYDYLAFLNNDIVVCPGWDSKIIKLMEKNNLEVASAAATENYISKKNTKLYRHRWKIIKDFFLLLFGQSYFSVKSMFNVMFPFWKKFSEKNFQKYKDHIEEGIVGSNVIMKKTALDKIGFWDEKIQLADLDLFYRTKKRSLEVGDIKPVHILDGVFLLHYLRLTLGKKNRWRNPVNFKDKNNLILLEQKYSKEEILKYDTRRICD